MVDEPNWPHTALALDREVSRLLAREQQYEALLSWLDGALVDHGFEHSEIADALHRSAQWRRSQRPPAPDAGKIQGAIEDAAKSWGEEFFYRPSPGQIWSHVAYRITQVVVRELTSDARLGGQ